MLQGGEGATRPRRNPAFGLWADADLILYEVGRFGDEGRTFGMDHPDLLRCAR